MDIIKPNLKKAVEALKEGKILVCPTDTVYGLVCDAENREAVERLYRIKKRPKNKPIPVFVSDIDMAKKIVNIGKDQEKFLKSVWPGAVTAVLEQKGGGGTIGVRMPDYKFVLDLVKCVGPLAETSANISGQGDSTKLSEVLSQFKDKEDQPDLVIDGGNLSASKASQVVDLRFSPPKVLRS